MKTTFELKEFSESILKRCLAWAQWMLNGSSDIAWLCIDSDGGQITPAMAELLQVLEALKAQGRLVTETSFAASAAALVFLAGNRRILKPNGIVSLHGIEIGVPIWALADNRQLPLNVCDEARALQKLAEEMVIKSTSIPADEVRRFMRTKKGKAFRGRDALEKGIATEIESAQEQLPLLPK